MNKSQKIYCLESNPNYVAVGDSTGKVYLFDTQKNSLVRSLDKHNASVSWLSFSHDGSLLLTGDFDGLINIWRFNDKLANYVRHLELSGWIGHIAFSLNDELVAISHESHISILDTHTWQQKYLISSFEEPMSTCFVKDEKAIWIGGREGGFGKWDYEKDEPIFYKKEPDGYVSHIIEDDVVYVWALSGVYKWDSKQNQLTLIAEPSSLKFGTCSGDINLNRDLLIFGAHEGEIGIYSIKQQKMLHYIKTSVADIYRVIFSSDKNSIWAGMQNGLVCKWRANDFTQEAILNLNV